jgi:hypothetical protein
MGKKFKKVKRWPSCSLHGLHWPTVDEGLDTAALTSVSLMLLGRRNATTGGSGNNLVSASLFWISFQCETTKQRLGDLRHHLKRRGYNDKVIESGFSKASEIDRNDLLEYKEKNINKRVPCKRSYTPFLSSYYGTLARVAIGDSTCNACHHMIYTGRPSIKV